jgi:lipoprotein-releasing system permease protein
MFYPLSFFIGMRYAKASKRSSFIAFINFFSVAGIALGLMSLITVLGVMNGFEGELKLRNLGITPHILLDADQARASHNVTEWLDSIDEVKAKSLHIQGEGLVQSVKGIEPIMFHGIEPDVFQTTSVVANNMLTGSLDNLQAGKYTVVIGRALSIKLQLGMGDKLRVITSDSSYFGPFGRMYSQRVYTVGGIYDMGSALDGKVLFMHIADSAKLLRSRTDKIAQTRLFLHDAFDYQRVTERLEQAQIQSSNWRTQQGALFDAVKMEKNMMSMMLLLIIAVAAFNIVSALVMVVTEKKGDIAILLTQGMSRKAVMSIFLFNGAYNGLKGTIIGLVLGLTLVLQMNNVLTFFNVPIFLGPNGQNLPIDIQWPQIILLVFVSLLLCFVASLFPAYQALKTNPATALKYE